MFCEVEGGPDPKCLCAADRLCRRTRVGLGLDPVRPKCITASSRTIDLNAVPDRTPRRQRPLHRQSFLAGSVTHRRSRCSTPARLCTVVRISPSRDTVLPNRTQTTTLGIHSRRQLARLVQDDYSGGSATPKSSPAVNGASLLIFVARWFCHRAWNASTDEIQVQPNDIYRL